MFEVLCKVTYLSGDDQILAAKSAGEVSGYTKYMLSDLDWEKIDTIDFGYDLACAMAGEEGYFVVPQISHSRDSFICRFRQREDGEYPVKTDGLFITPFGVKRKELSFCGFVAADIEYASTVSLQVEGGRYSFNIRFCIRGESPLGDVAVYYREMPYDEMDYCAVGNLYRNYLLENGICTPMTERHTDALDYGKESLYIRIRQAWKPVPSPVEEQTDENEPPIHVACDYAAVRRLIDKCKSEGVDKADFCLVGWNKGGHDGRWPQIFPTEPLLGTENELRELIAHAKEQGFTMSCHTNSTDAYSIADCYTDDDVVKNKDGSLAFLGTNYGGGKPRHVCAKPAYEYAKKELPKVRDLGFNGIHYIDVVSITQPNRCYNEKHPMSIPESQEYRRKMGQLCRELFGGFASEGARGYCMPALDYGLYISFHNPSKDDNVFADEYVPLWEIVYHGISLYNSYSCTINPALKPIDDQLLSFERGMRPSFYYYSKFVSGAGKNWMGEVDMRCETEEELNSSVALLKETLDDYKQICYLQDCFMIGHEKCGGVAKTSYSDGSVMTVDYNEKTAVLTKDGKTVWQKKMDRQ